MKKIFTLLSIIFILNLSVIAQWSSSSSSSGSSSSSSGGGGGCYYGCTNPQYCNYDPSANCYGYCYGLRGCMDPQSCNYNPSAQCDDGSCLGTGGCTNVTACNYDPSAQCNDGSCQGRKGCMTVTACNYNPNATCDDGSCQGTRGCSSAGSCNYNPNATCDDGSCVPNDVPGVSVSSGQNNTICSGLLTTFTASAAYGGINPTFVWKKNGGTVGNNNYQYMDSTLHNNDSVWVIMTSAANCVSPGTVTSNKLIVAITPSVLPMAGVTANPPSLCTSSGTLVVTYTANASNGGNSPSYQWVKDGIDISGDSATYIDSLPNNNDSVWVVMTSNVVCAASNPVVSNIAVLTVSPNVAPTIGLSGPDSICSGGVASYTATITNGGTQPVYQWKLNSAVVGTSNTFTSTSLSNGDTLSCYITSNAPCANPVVSSISTNIKVNAAPATPVVSQNGNVLTSSSPIDNQWYMNGGIINGASSQTYLPQQSGNYQVIVTEENCSSDTSNAINYLASGVENAGNLNVKIYPNPANDILFVQSNNTLITTIELIDLTGQTISTNQVNRNFYKLSISGLAVGNYMLRVHTNDGIMNKIISVVRE